MCIIDRSIVCDRQSLGTVDLSNMRVGGCADHVPGMRAFEQHARGQVCLRAFERHAREGCAYMGAFERHARGHAGELTMCHEACI